MVTPWTVPIFAVHSIRTTLLITGFLLSVRIRADRGFPSLFSRPLLNYVLKASSSLSSSAFPVNCLTKELGHFQEQDPEKLTGPDSQQQSIAYTIISLKRDKSNLDTIIIDARAVEHICDVKKHFQWNCKLFPNEIVSYIFSGWFISRRVCPCKPNVIHF
jgi:hypothetical protein